MSKGSNSPQTREMGRNSPPPKYSEVTDADASHDTEDEVRLPREFSAGESATSMGWSGLKGKVVGTVNGRTCFFVNLLLFTLTIASLIAILTFFHPLALERGYLAHNLNETSKLFTHCREMYDGLRTVADKMDSDLAKCKKDNFNATELLLYKTGEIDHLKRTLSQCNNHVADITTRLKSKHDEVSDLSARLGMKSNDVAGVWDSFQGWVSSGSSAPSSLSMIAFFSLFIAISHVLIWS